MRNLKQRGFSLIELLIVVAIILIIAAIAIPNLLRARIAANESGAAAGIRTINTGEVSYQSAFQTFSPTLVSLGPGGPAVACPNPPTAAASCYIDGRLASGTKSGYTLALPASTATTYNTTANPVSSSTGVRSFCSIEDGVVRFVASGGVATCTAAIPSLQ